MAAKIDNYDSRAKLELRRYFLRKYHHGDPPDVLDCCQGGGLLWRQLRTEFVLRSYWGVDVKPKKGRLKLDSVRILQQPGWPQNIVDIDTYGSPWKHWVAMLPNVTRPLTAFLTIGNHSQTAMQPGAHGCSELFIFPPSTPPVLAGKVCRSLDVTLCLTKTCEYGLIVAEAVESVHSGNARYIGIRIGPQKTATAEVVTPPRHKHKRSVKETADV